MGYSIKLYIMYWGGLQVVYYQNAYILHSLKFHKHYKNLGWFLFIFTKTTLFAYANNASNSSAEIFSFSRRSSAHLCKIASCSTMIAFALA